MSDDLRSDYEFLDTPRRDYSKGTAVVRVGGRAIDLNSVPDEFAAHEKPRGVGRAEMISRVAAETGLSHKQAGAAVNAIISSIEDELRSGQEVAFSGFGKFHVAERPARKARNPQTGETMTISATRVPRFTAGKALRKASAAAPTRHRAKRR